MDPQQQQSIQLAAGASPAGSSAKATPPPQCDHERMVVGNMCPSLYLAVYEGRMAEVTARLLQQHAAAAIDCRGTGIVMHGQCDILELTAERKTVVHVAAEQGHHELIRELYLRFRDQGLLSRQNSAQDTPLHCAARAGHARAVAVLVELARDRGVNIVGCKNEAGDTALHLVARHGHGATVEVLVSAAAEPAAELNNAGVSPLYLAVISGSVPAVRAIITKCKDASSMGPSAQNALHAAVFQSSEMVHLLLEWRPALADQVDSSGSSPLHFASSDGDRSIVSAILRAGPPGTVYKKDSSGLSALHVAARMGHPGVVKDMLESCPDAADLRDGDGGTFLHAACRERQSSVVSVVIKRRTLRGLLLDAQDRDGNTALHLAVAAGTPDVAEALLREGKVRADVLNHDGRTPFDLVEGSTSFFTTRQDCNKTQWSDRHVVEGIGKASDSFAVVAQLIATAAFAAGFNLPGGYGDTGKSNLSSAGRASFKYFLVLDTLALATAVVAVILLIYGKAASASASASRSADGRLWKSFVWALQCMWVSLLSLMLAFYAALYAADAGLRRVLTIIYLCISVMQIIIANWINPATTWRTILRFQWQCFHSKGRHAFKRQYPLAGAFVLNFCLFSVATFLVSFVFGVLLSLERNNAYVIS
ncbi:ankyrin repeat-containing protein At5g02620-like isoform X2 [Miscanthus floridulus]|uniref:ankyrin repeat-containing protein At5g02620-like isoform X2 n=1 Tax=Miscanthus floridulus TaxID=154761 RepID=UPI0034574AB2